MTYTTNERYKTEGSFGKKRYNWTGVRPATFAAGSGTLSKLTPVTFNNTTGFWQVWTDKSNPIETISSTGTISGGNWTLTINGETTANIAHSANTAAIQAAIDALGGIDPGDVVVTGGPLSTNTSVVLTFGGQFARKPATVTASLGSLTGGGSASLAHTQVGLNIDGFRGFLDDDITLDAANEVLGNVARSGEINIDDIPIVAGQYTLTTLKAELRANARRWGFYIDNLDGQH